MADRSMTIRLSNGDDVAMRLVDNGDSTYSFGMSAVSNGRTATLLNAVTSNGNGSSTDIPAKDMTFQATGSTSAGAGAASVAFQGSNVATPAVDGDWVDLGTVALTLSTTKSGGGFAASAPWKHVRAVLSGLSGTGAAVSAFVGY